MLIEMIFEAGVVLVVVVWTACSQHFLRIPQLIIMLQNNADFITLVHITCSRQHQMGSRALEKRSCWLYDFQTKVVFLFFHVYALYCMKL